MFSFERATNETSFPSLQFCSPAQQFKKKLHQETHINLHFYQVYYQLQV